MSQIADELRLEIQLFLRREEHDRIAELLHLELQAFMERHHPANHNISIFVENSNIARGCQILPPGATQQRPTFSDVVAGRRNDARDSTRRLRVGSFSEVVAGNRNVSLRVVAEASTTRVKHPRWQTWNACGFWVEWELGLASCVLSHVQDLERQGVDRSREVLALCTGDGQLARTVERVVRQGWRVEIWCWRATLDPVYHDLAQSGHVEICFLDDYRLQVTQYGLGELQPSQPVVRDGEPENPCTICLSEEAIFALRPCNHPAFCQSCLDPWMRDRRRRQQQMECPLCRSEIDDIQLAD
eukprot:Skav212830  [mRNA]  locus=scaffold2466:65685:66584:- [translate_table: standard]